MNGFLTFFFLILLCSKLLWPSLKFILKSLKSIHFYPFVWIIKFSFRRCIKVIIDRIVGIRNIRNWWGFFWRTQFCNIFPIFPDGGLIRLILSHSVRKRVLQWAEWNARQQRLLTKNVHSFTNLLLFQYLSFFGNIFSSRKSLPI